MKNFAWRGIFLNIPDEWELLFVGGSEGKGYVSLGDGSQGIKMEIKWSSLKRRDTISGILENFLKQIEKKARSKKESFKSIINAGLIER